MEKRKEDMDNFEQIKTQYHSDISMNEAISDSRFHYTHFIDDLTYRHLQEFFDRQKDHLSRKIHATRMTEFHGEFSKMYKFTVPIAPKNMS
jgi:hypothetical protein